MNCVDEKKVAKVLRVGNFTMKLKICNEADVSSRLTVSTTRSDCVEIPKNGTAQITGCGRTKVPSPVFYLEPTNSAQNKRYDAKKRQPSKLAWLGRVFGCRQIDPLTSKDQDIQAVPNLSQKSAFPCGDLSPSETSNGRLGNCHRTVRGQFVSSPTSPSDQDKLPKNVASTRYRSKRKHRLFRSNQVGIQLNIGTGLHRAQTVKDLSVFDTSNSRQEITRSKTNRSRPAVLATLWGTFTGCFRRDHNKGEPCSYNTSPSCTVKDDERAVSSNTIPALPQCPSGEIAGCYTRTVKSEETSPVASQMFAVGSGGERTDICIKRRTTMGQVASGQKEETHSCKRRKTVANKQTSVDAADLHRTAVELQLGQNIKPNVIKLPTIVKLPTITSSDQDHALPYPTINEKDLRRANKEGRPLVLGRGQSGVVRVMRYHQPGGSSSLVAVKRLINGSSSGTRAALMREIRAMLDVEPCPIFPRVVGVINRQSFAQEYIGNPKSLAALSITKALRGRPHISLLNWILIITDVIEGLSVLHQSGWAHCDLQTNNVLLWTDWSRKEASTRWEARIIDLGNAKWLESSRCLSLSLTEKETYYRDCRHIPAEVVEGHAPYGVASDIYSLGVLIKDVAGKITSLLDILPLAESCTTQDYQLRPAPQLFLKDLDIWCFEHTGCNITQLKSQIITYV